MCFLWGTTAHPRTLCRPRPYIPDGCRAFLQPRPTLSSLPKGTFSSSLFNAGRCYWTLRRFLHVCLVPQNTWRHEQTLPTVRGWPHRRTVCPGQFRDKQKRGPEVCHMTLCNSRSNKPHITWDCSKAQVNVECTDIKQKHAHMRERERECVCVQTSGSSQMLCTA
jgi:hypothetical protein